MDSISFDPIAKSYDSSRVFDDACFNSALDLITESYPPSKFKKLFEPGIGTGRIAIPLAERGYHVTGVDISGEMLKVLAEKLRLSQSSLHVAFQKADVTALPFADSTFDIAVAVHVFHLIRDWKKAVAEVFRVLKPGAPLVLATTGGGIEVPSIKDRYRELCAEYGQSARLFGLSSNTELQDYVADFGRSMETIQGNWRWNQRVRIDSFLDQIEARIYAFTSLISDAVHLKAFKKLENELREQYGNLETEIEVPNQIRLMLVQAKNLFPIRSTPGSKSKKIE